MCFRPPNATKPMKCPRCKTLNPGTAKKCRKCGLTEEEAIAQFGDVLAAENEQNKQDGPDKT